MRAHLAVEPLHAARHLPAVVQHVPDTHLGQSQVSILSRDWTSALIGPTTHRQCALHRALSAAAPLGRARAEIVAQVAVLGELHDDEELLAGGARADPQQVDDVDVSPDELHRLHLLDEVDHLCVRVPLLQHLDGDHGGQLDRGGDHQLAPGLHSLQVAVKPVNESLTKFSQS